MKFAGFNPLTLIDYPGHLAAIVFTQGCNLNCTYCHSDCLIRKGEPYLPHDVDNIMHALKTFSKTIDGVVITGGEPLIHGARLRDFMMKVKYDTSLKIKLDTNGTQPHALKKILKDKLVDYVAMDLKTAPYFWQQITGASPLAYYCVDDSIRLLMEGNIPYEFRTTVYRSPLFNKNVFRTLGDKVKGATNYYIQNYRYGGDTPKKFDPCTKEELETFANILRTYNIGNVGIRNI